jgi:ABC-type transport system involved in cytochrome c biogenesis ATPase subunit
MILRSLEVEGWRCFANRVAIGPLGDRINVVHGPNGIGKSTLMWALVRGLMDNHAVGGQAVAALRPWGRTLNPRVTIEFEHECDRYRLVKQFLGSQSSELSRFENGNFVRWREGEAADSQTRDMLRGVASSRGLTDERHWGMAQVLWAPQDCLRLPELATSVAGAIRASLGAQMSDARQDALEKKIDDAYSKIYTAGGKLKGGKDAPAIVAFEKELKTAELSQITLRDEVAAFEAAGREIEDLRSRHDQAVRDENQLSKDLEAARSLAKAYDALCAKRNTHREAAAAAEARFVDLRRRMDDLQAARAELRGAEEAARRLAGESLLQQKEVDDCAAEADLARTGLDAVRRRREDVQAAEVAAQRAARFVDNQRKLAEAEGLIAQVAAVEKELAELSSRRGELAAPDTARLREIQKQISRRDEAGLRLAAAMITVSIVPEMPLEMELLAGEAPGRRRVAPESPCNVQGAPAVEFRIAGVGVFRATGPTDSSVDQLRDERDQAQHALEALTEGFGAQDMAALQQLHDRAETLDKEIAAADVRRKTLLGQRRLDALLQQRAAASGAIEEALASYPDWATAPPDVDRLEAASRQAEHAFVVEVEQAEARWDKANRARSLADKKHSLHQADAAKAAERVGEIRRKLDELTADGRDDAARDAELSQRAIEASAARGLFAKAEEDLKAFAADPNDDVAVLDRQVNDARARSREAVERLRGVEGRLQEITAKAPYSALVEVEETIERLSEQIAAERLRNDAIRLLHDTVRECRDRAVGAVLSPVEHRATQTLERIAGPRLGKIRFDESLLPSGIAPGLASDDVSIDEISGGEREQVHLAVRLALAETISENGRQLIVLDDVLTATDTARLARTLRILEETADRFQILILTCHPERYRGLGEAVFVDLEERVREGV